MGLEIKMVKKACVPPDKGLRYLEDLEVVIDSLHMSRVYMQTESVKVLNMPYLLKIDM